MVGADAAPRTGLGARLRAARERAGYTAIQAAEKLHLDPTVIEALDNEDFDALVAPVYVRGHLKRYADLIGERSGELVDMYSARVHNVAPPDLTRISHAERVSAPRPLGGPVIGAIVTVAVVAGIWLVLKGLPMEEPAPSAALDVAPTAQFEGGPQEATESPVPPAVPLGSAASVQVADSAGSSLVEAPVQLTLTFSGECWLEIYDARGERLAYEMAKANRVVRTSGAGPLRVLLGNAAVATVSVSGRALAITAKYRRGESARFLVDSAGRLSGSH